ncbi:unnamed protein product [Urochloa humidicola]
MSRTLSRRRRILLHLTASPVATPAWLATAAAFDPTPLGLPIPELAALLTMLSWSSATSHSDSARNLYSSLWRGEHDCR